MRAEKHCVDVDDEEIKFHESFLFCKYLFLMVQEFVVCCAIFVKQTMAMHPHYKVLLNGKVSFVWRIDH